jgi:RNA polymerase sigma-70 factor (ECF subfamily)
MDRYAAGDALAFETLYDALAPRLYAFFTRRVRHADRACDLVQQTFLQIHHARGRFRPGGAVAPWAFAIGRRLLIDASRGTDGRTFLDLEEPENILACVQDSADAALDARRALRAVRCEFERLPEGHRAVFELVHGDGLSIADAGRVLGMTAGAVKVRLHRAVQRLRAAVDSPTTTGER